MNQTQTRLKNILLTLSLTFALVLTSNMTKATIVQFETSLGDFQVNLYDEATPESVSNFLTYVTSGSYVDTIFHRSISNFIVQGGGFSYNNNWPSTAIQTNGTVNNEPIYSNVRGTLAYAKIGGLPNSATSQWFFNLVNNSANLDNENSGYTVFGEVIGNGMDVIDAIAALNTYPLGGAFSDIPLQNYTTGVDPNDTNLILITNAFVLDSASNTASGLNPVLTTKADDTSSSGSGSFGFMMIFLLMVRSRFKFQKTFKS